MANLGEAKIKLVNDQSIGIIIERPTQPEVDGKMLKEELSGFIQQMQDLCGYKIPITVLSPGMKAHIINKIEKED